MMPFSGLIMSGSFGQTDSQHHRLTTQNRPLNRIGRTLVPHTFTEFNYRTSLPRITALMAAAQSSKQRDASEHTNRARHHFNYGPFFYL